MKLGAIILILFVTAVGVHYKLAANAEHEGQLFTQLLYLPSGKYLKPAAFGYDLLLSDFVYVWSIQYYGDPSFNPRMEYLRHTYDIITELDPRFIDAYQTGALFMFYEGRNPKAGLDLLDQGFKNNPDEWIIPADAGFYCVMSLKDYKKAAEYFQKASDVPGAPMEAKRIIAAMKFRAGDRLAAFQIWKQVYESTDKPSIKQVAFHHMHDLKILLDLDALRKAIKAYSDSTNHKPLNLQQLVSAGLIPEVPVDPDGKSYEYDHSTGIVKSEDPLTLYSRYK